MNEIVPEAREEVRETSIQLESKSVKLTPYGVEFLQAPSIEEWKNAVLSVQRVHGMTQFYLGDLAIYAESPVTGWGESKYTDLVETTGYTNQTLRQYAQVARRFTPEFRKSVLTSTHVLSFNHFVSVASMDDNYAGYYLRKAEENRWGVARLREEIIRDNNDGRLPERAERDVVAWKQNVRTSLTRIYDSEPEVIEIRSIRNGEVVAIETIEIN